MKKTVRHIIQTLPVGANTLSPDLRAFIDRVVVPALLGRFLREQAGSSQDPDPTVPALAFVFDQEWHVW